MMKAKITFVAAFLFLASISGCGIEAPSIPEPQFVGFRNEVIAGQISARWQSICVKSKVWNAYVRFNYDFSPERFLENQIYFEESDCRDNSILVHVQYEGSFRGDIQVSPFQVDFSYESALVIAKSENGRKLLSISSFCELKDWKINRPVDVTARGRNVNCPLKKTPYTRLDIFRFVGQERLEFGTGYVERASEQPSERPVQYSNEAPYFRIQ
jgi:hypothetical protein